MSSKTHVGVYLEGDEKGLKAALSAASKQVAELRAKTETSAKVMHKSFGMVNDTIIKLGGILAATFGIRAIVNFSKESMKLAASAEGVKNAFEKIGDSRRILEEIKIATRGVIDESDLMALALKAQNFKIPLQDLAKYFEFATKRAIQTGGSIQNFADIMVLALGGQSQRALKQLGLSTIEVGKALKETGGMLSLITRESNKMGDVADTATVRYDRFNATVKNLKEAWGEYLNQNTLIQKILENTTSVFKQLADPELNFWQKLMFSGKQYEKWLESAASRHGPNTGMSVTAFEDLMKLGAGVKIPPPPSTPAIIGPYDELVKKIYEAAEQSRKMAEAWKIVHAEIAGTNKAMKEIKVNMPTVSTNMPTGKLAGPPKTIIDTTEALEQQKETVQNLSGIFQDMFMNIDKGFKGMMDSMIESIKRLAAEIMAEIVVWTILQIVTGGKMLPLKEFFNIPTVGNIGSPMASRGIQNMNLSVTGKIAARDIYLSSNRYGNILIGNT